MMNLPADESPPAPAGPCVVGVGASAGGLVPLRQLLSAFRPGDGLSFVALLHQEAHQKSMVVELLASRTALHVVEVADTMPDPPEPDVVYVLAPGRTLTLRDDRLAPLAASSQQAPIDTLLTSLARRFGAASAAVVLSGSGSDGALGSRVIAGAGGIALAQLAAQAEFRSMPQAALGTGAVTQELEVGAMRDVLLRWARGLASAPAQDGERERALRTVLEIVGARRGFDFGGYKPGMLLRRIRRRMQFTGVQSLEDYAATLERAPDEVDALFDDLLIGVTEFFRDPEAWESLQREVIEPLVRSKGDDETIRVWVPGTSTGEEAYTVAILFLDSIERLSRRCHLQIFATDSDEHSLAIARLGIYPSGIAAQVGAQRMARYFSPIDDGQRVQVSAALRRNLIFGLQNLLADPPFTGLDLVTCRNLLIYLQPELQQRVLATLHFALKPGGHLLVGKAETAVTAEHLFRPVSSKARIFLRTGKGNRLPAPFRLTQIAPHKASSTESAMPLAAIYSHAAQVVQRILVDRFSPAGVLIDAGFDVLHFSGPTERFLAQPRGAPTRNLMTLVRDGLRSRLRAAVTQAAATGAEVQVRHAHLRRSDGYAEAMFTVIPIHSDDAPPQYLVVFDDEPAPLPSQARHGGADNAVIQNLEHELAATREDLRATIDGLEASNEELRIANEEVVSVNEELQTRNEELQSSKEELQSLNEELGAVNQQLQVKLGELETANNDLRNLLNSNEVAILRVDAAHCIQWFSPAAQQALQLVAGDVGRSVELFASPLLGQTLLSDIDSADSGAGPVQREIRSRDSHWYLRRTIPYRAEDGHADGVIVTMTDISEGKLEQQRRDETAEAQSSRLEQLVLERTRQLRRLSYELTRVEEIERKAIAEDLHDNLLQRLIAVQLRLDQAPRGDAALPRNVAQAHELLDRAILEIRTLAYQLSPSVLTEQGLVAAIEWLVGDIAKVYNLRVEVRDDGAPKQVEPLVGATLFRAVREMLINVAKHANTGLAEVSMRREAGNIEIRVSDQGRGFDLVAIDSRTQRGLGLRSTRERLGLIGGSVQVSSRPGHGCVITLTAPLGSVRVD